MLFIVKPKKGTRPEIDQYPYVLLVQDDWDDYGYKTTFYATLYLSPDEILPLGNVKILEIEQLKGFTKIPQNGFQELGENYCSLGENLEYYETLFNSRSTVIGTFRPSFLRKLLKSRMATLEK